MHLVEQPKTAMECLKDDERAFVMAYVEAGYSLAKTIESLKITPGQGNKFLARTDIRRAVMEVQNDIDSIDFLNEKWVKAQILRLFPMVMGDEETPALDSRGEQVFVRQFSPSVAMKILEYVAPKKASGVSVTVNTGAEFTGMSDEQLDEFIKSKLHTFPMEGVSHEVPQEPLPTSEAAQEALPEVTEPLK